MIDTSVRAGGALLIVGTVRGLSSEVAPLLARLTEFGPRGVGLGISTEELNGIADHFAARASEPLVPLTAGEVAEAQGLSRFGDVRVPNPTNVAVLEWSRARGISVEPLDPTDEAYARLFTRHISYFDLVRRTLRERKLTRTPLEAPSAEQFAERWHARISVGRGSRAFERAREAALVEASRRLAMMSGRAAIVVDRERYEGVVRALGGPDSR